MTTENKESLARWAWIRRDDGFLGALSVAAVVATLCGWRLWSFATAVDSVAISAIPDDAFYYFQIARNWAATGIWTFDGDVATTGFHPLYGVLLGGVFQVDPGIDWRQLLLIVGAVSVITLSISAFLTALLAGRLFGPPGALAAGAIFVTPAALLHVTYLLETWLVLPLTALGACLLLLDWRVARHVPVLVTVGSLGAFARTDFVLVPIAGAIAGAIGWKLLHQTPRMLLRSASMLGGALLSLSLVALTSYLTTGDLLQSSVQVKQWLTTLNGPDPSRPQAVLAAVVSAVQPHYVGDRLGLLTLLSAIVGLLTVLATLSRWRRGTSAARLAAIGTLFALLLILGYWGLYLLGSAGVQVWYTAAFLVPAAICFGALITSVPMAIQRPASIVALTVFVVAGISQVNYQPYWQQIAELNAADQLARTPLSGRVASWNAGILGFISNQGIVNLDGLVNPGVFDSITSGNLDRYLNDNGIAYIVDFPVMFTDPEMRAGTGQLRSLEPCLARLPWTDPSGLAWGGRHIGIYRVDDVCLSRN